MGEPIGIERGVGWINLDDNIGRRKSWDKIGAGDVGRRKKVSMEITVEVGTNRDGGHGRMDTCIRMMGGC